MTEENDAKETKPKKTVRKTVKKEGESGEEKTVVKKAASPRKKTTKEVEPPKVEGTVTTVPAETKALEPTPPIEPTATPAVAEAEKPAVIKAKPEVVKKVVIEKPVGSTYLGTGRRKTAIARVRLAPGKGQIFVNGQTSQQYFRHKRLDNVIAEPFFATQTTGKFDAFVLVEGSGLMGQADAVRHGIAKALVTFDESLRKSLRTAGLLTRDPRMVERKKYGQSGARKRFQFSKR